MISFSEITIGKMSIADVIIVLSYLLLCLVVGVKKATSIKDIKEYALGKGGISTGALVMTIYATYLGAGVMVGSIEWVSTIGVLFAIAVLFKPVRLLTSMWVFSRNIEQFRGCITSSDIMDRLYGKWGKRVSVVAYVLETIGSVSAQTAAIGYLLHYFFEVPIIWGIILGMGVVILYSTVGGVKGVVLTDILQFGVFYVMIPMACITLLYKLGGWNKIVTLIPAEKWDINLQKKDHLQMFLGAIFWAILPMATGPFIQRFLISMNSKQLVRTFKIVTVIDFTVAIMLCVLGFIVASQIQGKISGPETIWHVLSSNLPFMAKGLVTVGACAVMMSTADSYLNNAAVLIARDVLKPLFPSADDLTELKWAKRATILLGVSAALLATIGKGVMPLIWITLSFVCPLVTIPLCTGFLGFRTNERSFLAATVLAIAGTTLGAYIQGKFEVLSVFIGVTSSAIGLFGMHYFQKARGTLTRVAEEEKRWLEEREGIALFIPEDF